MPSITGTGVGSGLDVNNIVSSLMAVERQPLTLIQSQAGAIQARISAFGSLQGQLSNLADVAGRMADPAGWSPVQVDTSDSASLGISAAPGAVAGTHSVSVEQLAQGQVLASKPFGSSASVVGTGTLHIELGTTAAGVFTAKDGTSAVDIAIGADKQSLAGIRDAINAAKAGVTASIVSDGTGSRLVLRGADGAASSLRITATDDDGAATDGNGLSALAWDPAQPAGAGANLTQTQAAQDAKFTVDGIALTSASNTPDSALEGVKLTLKKVSAQPATVTVTLDTAAVRKKIDEFVNAYNALNTLVTAQTRADPSGQSRGPLQADSTAVSLQQQMHTILQGALAGAAGVAGLNQAGIVLQRDGSLAVDDKRMAPLLQDPQQLAQLFAHTQVGSDANTRGFAVRLKAWAATLTGDTGALSSRIQGLQKSATDNQKSQDAFNDRLTRTEARLRAQYQALDSQMSTLNQQMAKMKAALGLS